MRVKNPLSHNGKVQLWTRQHIDSLKDLESTGVFNIKYHYLFEAYGDLTNYHTELYKWFIKEAHKRVPKPDHINYPVWCAVSEKSTMPLIENTVIYQLIVDEKDVIYFDGSKWDYVLNHHYVPVDKEDLKRYRNEMKSKGFNDLDLYSFLQGELEYRFTEEKERIINSWIRVFDIKEWNPFKIQGNIWEFKERNVVKVIK